MNKLVCITGLTGSGKSVASDYFVKSGYQFVRFGQAVLDEVMRRKMEINEANEKRKVREELRKKHGMAVMAKLNLPNFRRLLKKGNVIGDGLYSFDEYKLLKKEFGKRFITIAIYSPPVLRYERLTKRKLAASDKAARHRPSTLEESKSRDYSELENLNKGGTIAMADYTIINTKTIEYFKKNIKKVYSIIN